MRTQTVRFAHVGGHVDAIKRAQWNLELELEKGRAGIHDASSTSTHGMWAGWAGVRRVARHSAEHFLGSCTDSMKMSVLLDNRPHQAMLLRGESCFPVKPV